MKTTRRLNASDAYGLYRGQGTVGGHALSKSQFLEFWRSLSDGDRRFWEDALRAGPTSITKEALEGIDQTGELRPSVRRRLGEYLQKCEASA